MDNIAPNGLALPTWQADLNRQCIQFNWTQPQETGGDTINYRLNINGQETATLTQRYYRYCNQLGDRVIYYLTALNRYVNNPSLLYFAICINGINIQS